MPLGAIAQALRKARGVAGEPATELAGDGGSAGRTGGRRRGLSALVARGRADGADARGAAGNATRAQQMRSTRSTPEAGLLASAGDVYRECERRPATAPPTKGRRATGRRRRVAISSCTHHRCKERPHSCQARKQGTQPTRQSPPKRCANCSKTRVPRKRRLGPRSVMDSRSAGRDIGATRQEFAL
jgi:hypothetical protein